MTNVKKINEVYKCNVCGNIVEVINVGGGELVCCGQPMELLKANAIDATREKHVPVIEKNDKGYLIKVGSIPHPMEEKHYIQWIELITENKVQRQQLKPTDKPQAQFYSKDDKQINARIYCNIHGLWKNK